MESWSDFNKLCESWLGTRSGRGGTIALSGFLYQFLVSLDALAEKSAHGAAPAEVFLETLSDLTTVDDHFTIATQVKSTMSSVAVSSALRELWEINAKALEETPNLVSQLRYRILARQAELKDISAAIARWRPGDDHNDIQLEAFKRKIEASIEPDPELRLARRLVSDFAVADPFGKIRKWLGDFLSDPTSEGLRRSCEAIAIDLQGFRNVLRERNRRFHIWAETDYPPATVEQVDTDDAVLTGQIPKASDLSAGRFASRKVYQRIHHDAELWLADRDLNNRDLLEVFWISGRSGSGKSVALLHLLSTLHEVNDSRTIIWLGSRSDKLAEAVTWARPFFAEGHEVIFAADDPFSVERQEWTRQSLIEAETELSDIFPPGSEAPRPSFFFCGPTEQLRTFQERLSSHVRVHGWPLAVETREDIEELRLWYRERTGRQDLAVGDDSDVLLVQLFFEWATRAPIGEFAHNFRNRLMGLMPDGRLFDLVAAILALNRIYALYPSGAVRAALDNDPALGGAFDQLHETEKHFVFEEDGSGFRIAHPHIANAIYISWFGEERDWRYRKTHLNRGIAAALEHGAGPSEQFAPLWAIANLAQSGVAEDNAETRDLGHRYQSIERALREILPNLYTTKFSSSASPLSTLPVWANLNAALQLDLRPSPLDLIADAVSAAQGHATGLRLSCHTLINSFPEFERGLLVVGDLLRRIPVWIDWIPVAVSYLYKGRLVDIHREVCNQVCDDAERTRPILYVLVSSDNAEEDDLRKSVIDLWIDQTNSTRRYTARVILAGLTRWPDDTKLLSAAWQILDTFADHPSWSYVWESLDRVTTDPERLEATGRVWLENQSVHVGGWDRVWERLWDDADGNDEVLRELALKMLLDPDLHVSWTHIWSKLWQFDEKRRNRLRIAAAQWLERINYDHGSWTYIWEAAWTDPGAERPRLLRVVKDWFRTKGAHPSWGYIWTGVWEAHAEDVELLRITNTWLENQGEHLGWSFVWEILFKANPDDAELVRITYAWLEKQGEHPSWSFVWEILFKANPDDAELVRITYAWLEKQGEHPSWSFVWEILFQADPDVPELLRITNTWLENQGKHPGWKFVWEIQFQTNPDDAELVRITYAWLEKQGEHPSWGFVWEILFQADPDVPELLRITNTWLENQGEHSGWSFVWLDCLRSQGSYLEEQRLAIGRSWIQAAKSESASWGFVWRGLWFALNANADRTWLTSIGMAYLSSGAVHPSSWPAVWRTIWDAGIGDTETLVAQANKLLVENAPAHVDAIKKRLSHGRSPKVPLTTALPQQDYRWNDGWQARWQEEESDKGALAGEALNWLEQLDWQQGGWSTVWQEIWQKRGAVPVDLAVLKTVAYDWLDRVDPEHPNWSKVWLAVWSGCESHDARIRLSNAADAWLTGAGKRREWTKVWLTLWDFEALRVHLRKIAEKPERIGDISEEDRAVIEAILGV